MSTNVVFTAGKSTSAKSTCKCGKRKKPASTTSSVNAKEVEPAVTFAEDVMKSMIARVKKSESEAINAYCTALINDKFSGVKEEISDLRTSVLVVGARLDHLQEDVHCIRDSCEKIKAELLIGKNVTDKSSIVPDHRINDLEVVLSKTEDLIGGLLTDMSNQNKEMAEWRERFNIIGPRSTYGNSPNDLFTDKCSNDIPKNSFSPKEMDKNVFERLALVEVKMKHLERKEKKEIKNSVNQKDIIQLESKISALREQILDYKETLTYKDDRQRNKNRNVSPQDTLFDDIDNDNNLRNKIKLIDANTRKVCRSLSSGLNDVQQVALELLKYSDQIYNSFGIISEKLFLPKNMCPRINSSYHVNNHEEFNDSIHQFNHISIGKKSEKNLEDFSKLSPISKNNFY